VSKRTLKANAPAVHLVALLVDSLISEKCAEFRLHSGVTIKATHDKSMLDLFVKVEAREFKRALSNVINNAVESLNQAGGAVEVTVFSRDRDVVVRVRDNGRGMSAETLVRVEKSQQTLDKAGGMGLGLKHARKMAGRVGGAVKIFSDIGLGTSVDIVFPKAKMPVWYLPSLSLVSGATVAVVDDDRSIHHVWDERLRSAQQGTNAVFVEHFYAPAEFRAWVARRTSEGPLLALIDFEFAGHQENGIDLCRSLPGDVRRVLVTSRYADVGIQTACRDHGLSLLPKNQAHLVPVLVPQ
jgi:hypothetical protein